ncbi:hypothetical protein LSH36_97g03031 [Paralvinella palmiformis]|uniref:BAI1-associated protein 3 n=1 Tax=Paralvinella palmiformis TaxID=53620 RepID=A0AAD9NBW1_9ANNE|nr:hypothetical protein LSH36_97g03031 [Paralvinella palmiformis]
MSYYVTNNFPYGHMQVPRSRGVFFPRRLARGGHHFLSLVIGYFSICVVSERNDSKNANRAPPLETGFGLQYKLCTLTQKEFELLYIEVLYTIKHKIGTTSGHHLPFMQDLYLYAREAFGVTPEQHARLLARASEEKPPVLILNVTVVEARGLEAKDADGFSDPYCMLGILPGSRAMREHLLDFNQTGSCSSDDESGNRGRKESALKKFSQSFKKRKDKTARDLVPARFIKTTSVITNTLDPVWNEKFRLDHDDEFSVADAARKLNEVSGLKGLGRYFKQIAQSARTSNKDHVDDFLGSVDILLDDIPSTGIDDWFDLEARSSRSNVEGQIRLRLNLATREDRGYFEEDPYTEIKEHEDLMCVFIEHEIKSFKGEIYHWQGHLSQAAQTILHQHAIQGDITEVQQAMCRWAAFSRKHREHPFDWHLLLRLLEAIDEEWEPGSSTRDEEEILAESFDDFIQYCLALFSRHRDIYPTANKIAQVRFECMLRCLNKIYEMPVFRRCCPFKRELRTELIAAIKKSSADLYHQTKYDVLGRFETEENTVASLTEVTNRLNIIMGKTLYAYNPLFQKVVNVNYFTFMYRQLEKILGEDLNADLSRFNMTIPEVDEHRANHVTAQQMGLDLFELYLALQAFCCFREHLLPEDQENLAVTQFYEIFKLPVQRWINVCKYKLMSRIKKADNKVEKVDGNVKQSTSAVDVACCFGQLCITINDIEQVRRALKPLPDALKFNQIISSIEQHQGEKVAKQAKGQLMGILKAADEEMIRKIKLVVDRVADKAIGDLMNYLDSNLVTLNTNLFRSNFDRILDSIWVEVLEEMQEVLDNEDVKAAWFFERLYESLNILVEFFHANDKGLPLQVIKNQHYKDLNRQLKLNCSSTRELIETFYLEKLEEQGKTRENRYGTLSVRVYYNTDAEILSVEVLNARNILPLDPNGLSDPFVLIELCPQSVFPRQTVQQTQIIKKTLNPTFDESFEFCVTKDQCQHRGACIVFTVMDHDLFLTNDFAGEVYFSLNNIPGIKGEEVSGFSALSPLCLPLTHPKKANPKMKSRGAIRALELRDHDREAMEFVKKRREIESHSQNV